MIFINGTLTHLQVNMEEQSGKGKKAFVFHSIINSNDLQIVQRTIVSFLDSLPDS